MLHAATGNTNAWQYQNAAFVAAGYRPIAYDRRGWGRTIVEATGPASTAADDLRGLLDTLGLDRIHLVSTAGGGFVAFDFAIAFPTRLRSLVVADSIGGVQDREILDLEARIRPRQFQRRLSCTTRCTGRSRRPSIVRSLTSYASTNGAVQGICHVLSESCASRSVDPLVCTLSQRVAGAGGASGGCGAAHAWSGRGHRMAHGRAGRHAGGAHREEPREASAARRSLAAGDPQRHA